MNVPVYCSSTLQAGTKGCFLKHTNSNAQREHEDSCLVSEIKKSSYLTSSLQDVLRTPDGWLSSQPATDVHVYRKMLDFETWPLPISASVCGD